MEIHPTLCYYCNERPGIKTDSKSRLICIKCALGNQRPYIQDQKIGRNFPCICNSGKKFKNCCLKKQK